MLSPKVTDERLWFGLFMHNRYWFLRYFWKDDLSMTPSIKQRMMFCDTSQKKLLCTARKVGKTLLIESYIIRSVMIKTNDTLEEYMFHTPAQNHMNPVRNRIISKLMNVSVFRIMVKRMNLGDGILDFHNNCIWHLRIEGSAGDGRNMVGIRAHRLAGDEGAYSGEGAHRERLLTKMPNCDELWAGVPNGKRGTPFFNAAQTIRGKKEGWHVHRMTTFDNPLFDNTEARENIAKDYGGVYTQDYITQALGEWGEEAFSSFSPAHMVQETKRPYKYYEYADKDVESAVRAGERTLDLMFSLPRVDASRFVIGMDHGFSPDPSVITVSYDSEGTWYVLARVKLVSVHHGYQSSVIDSLCRQLDYKVKKIVIDQAGEGHAVASNLLVDVKYAGRYSDNIILNADFGGRVDEKDSAGNTISKPRKQWAMEMLKVALANEAMRRRVA